MNEKKLIDLKQLRINILTEKLKTVNDDDEQKVAVLDILETVANNVIVDPKPPAKANESDLTAHRKVATVLDSLLKQTSIDIMDGETTCKVSKLVAKTHENLYGDSVPLNRGFGRRIDLLLAFKNVEISTNEWKRKKSIPNKLSLSRPGT